MTERDIAARLIGVLEAIATTSTAPLNVSRAGATHMLARVQWLADKEAKAARELLEEMSNDDA